jgi:hypothetical protein
MHQLSFLGVAFGKLHSHAREQQSLKAAVALHHLRLTDG